MSVASMATLATCGIISVGMILVNPCLGGFCALCLMGSALYYASKAK